MSPHLTEEENSSRGCIQACPYLPLQSEQVSLLMADESFYGLGTEGLPSLPSCWASEEHPKGLRHKGASKQVGLPFREFGISVSVHSFTQFTHVPVPKLPLVSSPVFPPPLPTLCPLMKSQLCHPKAGHHHKPTARCSLLSLNSSGASALDSESG